METAIQGVWWLGLVLAVGATAVLLKEVFLVVGALRDILRLAEITRSAAGGLVRNLADVGRLHGIEGPAGSLREATRSLAQAAGTFEQRVAALPRGAPR